MRVLPRRCSVAAALLQHSGQRAFSQAALVDIAAAQLRAASTRAGGAGHRKQHVCIVGAGWGAFAVARELDRKLFDITMVSERNHFLFTPLLTSACVGTLSFRALAEPVRRSFPDIKLVTGTATALDVQQRHLTVLQARQPATPTPVEAPHSTEIPYDALVIATGARSNTFGVPGVEQHAHFLRDLRHARAIRQHVIDNCEAATFPGVSADERRRLLSCLIVGGGPTGIELAAELHDFLTEDLRRLYPSIAGCVRITVLEASSRVLGGFDDSLRSYVARRFERQSIVIRTGSACRALSATEATLADGTVIPFGIVVWATGLAPTPFVNSISPLSVQKDEWGHLMTSYGLKVHLPDLLSARGLPMRQPRPSPPSFPLSVGDDAIPFNSALTDECAHTVPGLYALGDAASVGDRGFAATAQVAEQQGRWLGRTLNAALREAKENSVFSTTPGRDAKVRAAMWAYRPPSPFHYRHRGSMVVLGKLAGISDFSSGGPVAPLYGVKLSGFASWLLYRSAFLTKLLSWRNRVQVPMEWLRTFVFGRDTTQF